MKIGVLSPISGAYCTDEAFDHKRLQAKARPGTEIIVSYARGGRNSIEGAYDDALATPSVLSTARELEKKGVDAIVINCTADTAASALKECLSVPVVAPMMASMYLAAQLSHRFCVVTFMARTRGRFWEMARSLGLGDRFTSVELISSDCENDIQNNDIVVTELVEAGKRNYECFGSHAMILGCTALEMVADKLKEEFEKIGLPMIVLEPYSIALHQAEDLVDMNLSQSKLSFPYPNEW